MNKYSWNPFKHKKGTEIGASNEPSRKAFVNAVYYPNWRVHRKQPPSSLNLEYVSHIYYAFARLVCANSQSVHGIDSASFRLRTDGTISV